MWQKLGFASCKRNLGATEGINVLIEKKNLDGKWAYGLSCIEYTEFEKFGVTDGPRPPSRYRIIYGSDLFILHVVVWHHSCSNFNAYTHCNGFALKS